METRLSRAELPLVVVVGPTACGKTALAIDLAKECGGEIICADSRTVYRGMDIGTAKPTIEEQATIPHWGLDLVDPDQHFTVADFKRYADEKISEIRARHHVPFLVGGTGLYVDAVIFDYQFGEEADKDLRRELEELSVEQLHDYCKKNNIPLPDNKYNKRYVIRAIEQKGVNQRRRATPISKSIIVGIATDRELLRTRIALRAEQLFKNGVVEEATLLGKKYGWQHESMTGNIYPLIYQYLEGAVSAEECQQKFVTLDWRLAKRQLTWLRRNAFIHWGTAQEGKEYVRQQLANE